jgi:hypothetical protein
MTVYHSFIIFWNQTDETAMIEDLVREPENCMDHQENPVSLIKYSGQN